MNLEYLKTNDIWICSINHHISWAYVILSTHSCKKNDAKKGISCF